MRTTEVFIGALCLIAPQPVSAEERTNVVWIIVEDMSADFGCYGQSTVKTPNVDRLAKEGVKFTNAIVTCPVCSPARSALITGMYQTSIGAHQHRSGRGRLSISLPKEIVPVPELFRKAGYLTQNLSVQEFLHEPVDENRKSKTAKTDYNFHYVDNYTRNHWRNRPKAQPFFIQIQLKGGKLRGTGITKRWPQKVKKDLGSITSPASVKLPPYLPNDKVIRQDRAQYLDAVRYTDWEVGRIVNRLKETRELDNTYIFFITDHGISHVRNKQFLYEGGVHIPLIIRGPNIRPSVRKDPVVHIDLAATSLGLTGLKIPKWMQSQNILAKDYQPRKVVFSARDRCDETVDRIRCARTQRYKYIRNFYPKRPYLQPNAYKDNKPILQAMRRLHKAGKLNQAQSLIMASSRPKEELYDLASDPYELRNLSSDPKHSQILTRLRKELDQWIVRSGDQGVKPESTAMYDSDMAVYLQRLKKRNPGRLKEIQRNIATMKKWAAEGK